MTYAPIPSTSGKSARWRLMRMIHPGCLHQRIGVNQNHESVSLTEAMDCIFINSGSETGSCKDARVRTASLQPTQRRQSVRKIAAIVEILGARRLANDEGVSASSF